MARKRDLDSMTGLIGLYAQHRCRAARVPVGATITQSVLNLRKQSMQSRHEGLLWLIGEYEREFPAQAAEPVAAKLIRRLRGDVIKALRREEREAADKALRDRHAEMLAPDFYSSLAWKRLRYKVLVARGARCECCGRTAANGVVMHVDHVQPRSKFPHLALEEANMQVLCEDCNFGKGAGDQSDWRHASAPVSDSIN